MTAPLDPIKLTQGTEIGGIGHGADPDPSRATSGLATGDFTSG